MTAPFFSRERIVAPPGWSRWMVPPAALSIHLSIGAAYSWSVFKKPLEGALDISGTLSALPFTLGIVVIWSLASSIAMPMRQTLLNGLIPSSHRATVLSFDNTLRSAGVRTPVTGYGSLLR